MSQYPEFTFHHDPGHGWLQVPITKIIDLGLETKVSNWSYRNEVFAFLEEDCDMPMFLSAHNQTFGPARTKTVYHNGDAPCRNLRKWKSQ